MKGRHGDNHPQKLRMIDPQFRLVGVERRVRLTVLDRIPVQFFLDAPCVIVALNVAYQSICKEVNIPCILPP